MQARHQEGFRNQRPPDYPGGFFVMQVDIEVKGLIETQKKLDQVARDLHGSPMIDAMQSATLIVTREARVNAPVDTGRLRSSITPEVRPHGNDVQGVVGSNVVYAPFQEVGTRPFWPRMDALATWASRHGTTAYLVALGISRHGIKDKRYLQKAFEDNRQRIIDIIERGVKGIVNK